MISILVVWTAVLSHTLAVNAAASRYPVGSYDVSWDGTRLTVARSNVTGTWQSTALPFVTFARHTWSAEDREGMFKITDRKECASTNHTVDTFELQGQIVYMNGTLDTDCLSRSIPFTVVFSSLSYATGDHLSVKVSIPEDEKNNQVAVVGLSSISNTYEKVLGLGVQYTFWDLKKRLVPIITSEQGVGRGLEPLTAILNTLGKGAGGNWHTTYCPVPHYVTDKFVAFFLENTEYSLFDFRNDDVIHTQVFSNVMEGRITIAASPLNHIKMYTEYAGRMQPLPDWIGEGAIVGYYGGTDNVTAMYHSLTAAGLNISAFWLQDWSGIRDTGFGERLWWNWELDETYYHDWDTLISTLATTGTRVLGYINPYLADTVTKDKPDFKTDYFKEAASLGYLIKNDKGEPYILASASKDFTFGTMDFTNPKAQEWYTNVMKSNMIGKQLSGWMADFGEYLPFDAVLNSSSPDVVHNNYPYLWAETNSEAVAHETSEPVAFFRSGAARSPSKATLFWLGDQLVTWDSFDGLRSALIGMLTSGLSGHSLQHSDIGGYTMVKQDGVTHLRSKELLLRWMELSAISDAIFRTHQGNLPTESWQIYSDNQTTQCFIRMSALHQLFAPYRKELMAEAAASGAPLTRHLWLNYPEDQKVHAVLGQFMLGTEFLVAPVLDSGANEVEVYIPTGTWVFAWNGTTVSGPSEGLFEAPFGQPVILFPSHSTVGTQLASSLSSLEAFPCNPTLP